MMSRNVPNRSENLEDQIENNENEELPQHHLDLDDKTRIVKGLVLIFLFASVVISSMIYYNAPNYNPNLVFESEHDIGVKHDRHLHSNPVYRLQSRFTTKNQILLELKLERKGITNTIKSETVKNLNLIIKLAKNKARIQISQISEKSATESNLSDHFVFPKNLLENEDLELENDGRIESLESSNIGIYIVNHPFSFYLYNKETGERLFDTTHSKESPNFDHYLYFAKNYIQLSTRLPKGHFTYGLGERFSSLRLNRGKYILWAADKTQGAPIDKNSNENSYSSIPSYITVNPERNNGYGAVMLNSSPMEVQLEDDYLTYKLTSGSIDLFIFGGPRPKEVIVQMQRTFGMPFVPSFDSLNWQANIITDNPVRDLLSLNQTLLNKDKAYNLYRYPVKDFWIDNNLPLNYSTHDEMNNIINSLKDSGLKVFTYRRSPLAKSSQQFEAARNSTILITTDKGDILYGKTSFGDVCFIDYLAPNSLSFIKKSFIQEKEFDYDYSSVILLKNEPSQDCNGECTQGYSSKIELPYLAGGDKKLNLEQNTLPLSAKQYSGETSISSNQNILLNTHNLYSLQEMKTYYHALIDSGVKRPIIFSRSTFVGAQQYGGKWLGYLESSWKGLQMALVQTMNFNMFGNPNTIHEACGFSRFVSNASDKLQNKEKDSKYSQELCIRWLQFSAINPYARFNDFEILPLFDENHKKALDSTFKLRAMFSLYIYGYMIKNFLEGGSMIRPMLLDFKSDKLKTELHQIDSQLLLGSNFLISPVLTFNERKKKTYFPSDRFYDFYTGEIMNELEKFVTVEAPLNKLPIYARAGFISPIQIPDENLKSISDMRKFPIELIVALDANYRAAGSIIIDDGKSDKQSIKKDYFKLDITSMQTNKSIEIIFKKFETLFKIPNGEYPSIRKLHIFGVNDKPTKVMYISRRNDEEISKEYKSDSLMYIKEKKVLYINNLDLSLNKEESYRFIIQY